MTEKKHNRFLRNAIYFAGAHSMSSSCAEMLPSSIIGRYCTEGSVAARSFIMDSLTGRQCVGYAAGTW